MRHIHDRLRQRGIDINGKAIENLSMRCEGDVALLLHKFDTVANDSCLPFCQRKESNGDLVYLVVRNKYPVTVMFRRSEQTNTIERLRVSHIVDIQDIIKNYVVKEK